MQPGKGNLLLVDDVVPTSGTMTTADELCQRSSFKVEGLVALMDLKLRPRQQWNSLTLCTALDYAGPGAPGLHPRLGCTHCCG